MVVVAMVRCRDEDDVDGWRVTAGSVGGDQGYGTQQGSAWSVPSRDRARGCMVARILFAGRASARVASRSFLGLRRQSGRFPMLPFSCHAFNSLNLAEDRFSVSPVLARNRASVR